MAGMKVKREGKTKTGKREKEGEQAQMSREG
jgi:hypothetical protein